MSLNIIIGTIQMGRLLCMDYSTGYNKGLEFESELKNGGQNSRRQGFNYRNNEVELIDYVSNISAWR